MDSQDRVNKGFDKVFGRTKMKEIEKLAIDGANARGSFGSDPGEHNGYIIGFEAGFRKAKELLRTMESSKTRSWFEIPMKDLERLGESEVE